MTPNPPENRRTVARQPGRQAAPNASTDGGRSMALAVIIGCSSWAAVWRGSDVVSLDHEWSFD